VRYPFPLSPARNAPRPARDGTPILAITLYFDRRGATTGRAAPTVTICPKSPAIVKPFTEGRRARRYDAGGLGFSEGAAMERSWGERFDACLVVVGAAAAIGVVLSGVVVVVGGALRMAGLF
jgi:hypothetical protein